MSASTGDDASDQDGHSASQPTVPEPLINNELATARKVFLKVVVGGMVGVIITMFALFSIFWGALWKIPDHTLPGWFINFDKDFVGQNVSKALLTPSPSSRVTWTEVASSQFPGGLSQLASAVQEEQTWVAISINEGASARLMSALSTPNASYDGSEAITVFGAEARNENAFRGLILPSVQATLQMISNHIALSVARQAATTNFTTVLTTSPQTLVQPIFYQIRNVAPFDEPVASAVTFVGLLYQVILAFFIVMISFGARGAAGLERLLSTRSLFVLRVFILIIVYFVVSAFYSLLSLAFQADFGRKFGASGFVIFWMLNWAGMLISGLIFEGVLTLLTVQGIPFFLLLWIIINVSVCIYPIEVMPRVFRYGYASPFYNVSQSVRVILFRTKNTGKLLFHFDVAPPT
ncbi:hypothetical protein AX17_007012 [Amanita inopinata Kibby_2008]|nr:hypothetical protein AX17_007012 [Amanita inopinata Kibby_2008]